MNCPARTDDLAALRLVAERGRLELLLSVVVVELVALGIVDGLPYGDVEHHEWITAARTAAAALFGARFAHTIAGWCADVFRVRHDAVRPTRDDDAAARRITELWHEGASLMDELRLLARVGAVHRPLCRTARTTT